MPKAVFPTLEDLHSLLHHARNVVVKQADDLAHGCRPELSAALALTSLESWRLATRRPKDRDPLERKQVLMLQALQITIHYYETPEIVETIGVDQAAALRQQYLQILLELTGP